MLLVLSVMSDAHRIETQMEDDDIKGRLTVEGVLKLWRCEAGV